MWILNTTVGVYFMLTVITAYYLLCYNKGYQIMLAALL